ncbi:MAG: hypothetical protein ABJA98_10240 [Acidobacteriota bacterium]
MIAVSDVGVWPKQIVVANFDHPARVNHHISVEVVTVTYSNTNAIAVGIIWPEPATLREGIMATYLYLTKPPAATSAFDPIVTTLLHA